MYIWDKPSGKPGKVVYDDCKNDWNSLKSEVQERVTNYVQSTGKVNLTSAQYLALVAILLVAIVVLMALIATLPVFILVVATFPDPSLSVSAALWIRMVLG